MKLFNQYLNSLLVERLEFHYDVDRNDLAVAEIEKTLKRLNEETPKLRLHLAYTEGILPGGKQTTTYKIESGVKFKGSRKRSVFNDLENNMSARDLLIEMDKPDHSFTAWIEQLRIRLLQLEREKEKRVEVRARKSAEQERFG